MISIIIPVFNACSYTEKCLNSIKQHTVSEHEIIVVDNGSTDNTPKVFEKNSTVKYVRHAENKGFAAAVNSGLKNASGEFCVILNNDTLVCDQWLQRFLSCYENAENPGIIGAVSNNAGKFQSVHTQCNEQDAQTIAEQLFSQHQYSSKKTELLSGFCMFFKTSLIHEIGYFDEQFGVGNFEDNDMCIRCKNAGYFLYVAQGIFIFHYGQRTFDENNIDYQKLFYENKHIFEKKWNGYYAADRSELLTLIDIPPKKVLDIGCASGVFGSLLKEKFSSYVIGIELNEHAAAIAAEKLDTVHCCNVEEHLPEFSDTFDLIVLADVIEHLVDPESLIRKLIPLLSDNGSLIFSIPNVAHFTVVMDLLWGRWEYTNAGILDRTHLRFFTRDSIEHMMKRLKLNIEKMNTMQRELPPQLMNVFKQFEQLRICKPNFAEESKVVQYLIKVSR